MTAQLRFTRYRLTDSQGNQVLETDFNTPLVVQQAVAPVVRNDLSSFTVQNPDSPHISELSLAGGGLESILKRNYTTKEATLSAELPEEIRKELSNPNPFFLEKFDLAYITSKLTLSLQSIGNTGELEAKVNADPDAKKLLDLETQLNNIESELAAQRRVDEAQIASGELEGNLTDIDEKLKSVDELVLKQKEIQDKISQYSQALGDKIEQKSESYKNELLNLRNEILNLEVSEQKAVQPLPELPKPGWQAKWILSLPAVLFAVASVVALLTSETWIFLVALVSSGVIGGLYWYMNRIFPDLEVSKRNELAKIEEEKDKKEDIAAHKGVEMEKFFLSKAWYSVLQAEISNIEEAMKNKLGEVSYAEVEKAKQEITTQLNEFKTMIESHSTKEISPEQYLEKRRKMSMLKVEKSKLADTIQAKPEGESLVSAVNELLKAALLTQAGVESGDGGEVDSERVTALNIPNLQMKQESGVLSVSTDGNWHPLAEQRPLATEIYLALKLADWSKDPSLPFIAFNLLSTLDAAAGERTRARIDQVKNLGQVILVNLATN